MTNYQVPQTLTINFFGTDTYKRYTNVMAISDTGSFLAIVIEPADGSPAITHAIASSKVEHFTLKEVHN